MLQRGTSFASNTQKCDQMISSASVFMLSWHDCQVNLHSNLQRLHRNLCKYHNLVVTLCRCFKYCLVLDCVWQLCIHKIPRFLTRQKLNILQVDMRDLLNTSVLSRSGSDLEPPSTFLGGCTVSQLPSCKSLIAIFLVYCSCKDLSWVLM